MKSNDAPIPNVLLLVTDQHRLSGVGAYGQTPSQTPWTDAMARRGVRFENTYTACPLCSPARASLITGLHVHAHGVTGNVHEAGTQVNELHDSPEILPRRLAANGIRCGYTGKWHLGTGEHQLSTLQKWWNIPNRPALPTNRGFEGVDFPGHGDGGYYYPEYKAYLEENGFRHEIRPHAVDGEKITIYGVLDGPVESTVSYYLASQTIELIDRYADAGEPFFLWHNDWGPHGPYFVPEEYYERYRNVRIEPWPNFEWEAPPGHPCLIKRTPHAEKYTWEDWEEVLRYYYAYCSMIDDQFARIYSHLVDRGLAENTVTIMTADHGETIGSHGGLTDKGFSHFDEIQRIPLIIHDPRQEHSGGKTVKELASILDLYPTVCELTHTEYDRERLHGSSLVPLMEGREVVWRDSVFVEFFSLGNTATNMVTCRHQNIKYGWTATGCDELFDLAKDPDELENRISDPEYDDLLQDMHRRMYTFMMESGYPSVNDFVRSRLNHNIYRYFESKPDPAPVSDYLVDMKWR